MGSGQRKAGRRMIENIFNPVILCVAQGAIGRIALWFVVQGSIVLRLMAAYAGLDSSRHTAFMTISALHHTFMGTLQFKTCSGMVEGGWFP
jgi:hypothetical protein